MKPVIGKATPAAAAVLKQATALYPKRKKTSDGLLPSKAHQLQNPNSDHNTGLAVDLTHDPENGVDCAIIFEKLKEDQRINYIIFKSKIWSRARRKEGNRKFTGNNPHNKHLHISIDSAYANDTSPWFWWLNQPKLINQVLAKIQPAPTKKITTVSKCTCCEVHRVAP